VFCAVRGPARLRAGSTTKGITRHSLNTGIASGTRAYGEKENRAIKPGDNCAYALQALFLARFPRLTYYLHFHAACHTAAWFHRITPFLPFGSSRTRATFFALPASLSFSVLHRTRTARHACGTPARSACGPFHRVLAHSSSFGTRCRHAPSHTFSALLSCSCQHARRPPALHARTFLLCFACLAQLPAAHLVSPHRAFSSSTPPSTLACTWPSYFNGPPIYARYLRCYRLQHVARAPAPAAPLPPRRTGVRCFPHHRTPPPTWRYLPRAHKPTKIGSSYTGTYLPLHAQPSNTTFLWFAYSPSRRLRGGTRCNLLLLFVLLIFLWFIDGIVWDIEQYPVRFYTAIMHTPLVCNTTHLCLTHKTGSGRTFAGMADLSLPAFPSLLGFHNSFYLYLFLLRSYLLLHRALLRARHEVGMRDATRKTSKTPAELHCIRAVVFAVPFRRPVCGVLRLIVTNTPPKLTARRRDGGRWFTLIWFQHSSERLSNALRARAHVWFVVALRTLQRRTRTPRASCSRSVTHRFCEHARVTRDRPTICLCGLRAGMGRVFTSRQDVFKRGSFPLPAPCFGNIVGRARSDVGLACFTDTTRLVSRILLPRRARQRCLATAFRGRMVRRARCLLRRAHASTSGSPFCRRLPGRYRFGIMVPTWAALPPFSCGKAERARATAVRWLRMQGEHASNIAAAWRFAMQRHALTCH